MIGSVGVAVEVGEPVATVGVRVAVGVGVRVCVWGVSVPVGVAGEGVEVGVPGGTAAPGASAHSSVVQPLSPPKTSIRFVPGSQMALWPRTAAGSGAAGLSCTQEFVAGR